MPSVTVTSLLSDALYELNVLGVGETLSAEQGALCLSRLNQLFDNWNATTEAIYVNNFSTYTFVANQQDYTIGPTGSDFTMATARPTQLLGANVILDTVSPSVRNPITLRDYQWWMNLTVRSVTTTFPTDVYYAPDWPNGTLHFWPKPTQPYGLELVSSLTLGQVTLSDTVNLPMGYQNALVLTLAEDVASMFGRQPTPLTMTKAREARARIFQVNDFTPRIRTQDAGMPSNHRNRSNFNYRTGLDINVNR
jgi:hypothetical protein